LFIQYLELRWLDYYNPRMQPYKNSLYIDLLYKMQWLTSILI
jgi:hypothetical protein